MQATKLTGALPNRSAVGVNSQISIECGLVIKSIGYRGISIDDSVPFDEARGAAVHTAGEECFDGSLFV